MAILTIVVEGAINPVYRHLTRMMTMQVGLSVAQGLQRVIRLTPQKKSHTTCQMQNRPKSHRETKCHSNVFVLCFLKLLLFSILQSHFGSSLDGHLVLEPCLLTDMVEFHCMVRLHLSAAVTAPIAIRTGSHSRRQLRSRNVLSILVSQLSKASQATAVTQHSVPSDSVIRQQKHAPL